MTKGPIPADLIERARAYDVRDVAERRCGAKLEKSGKEWEGACPRCGGENRFAVRGQLWNCRGCGRGGYGPVDLAMHLVRVEFREAVEWLTGDAASSAAVPKAPRERQQPSKASPALWPGIWRESVDPRVSPVERHLASRGLLLPAKAAGEALRYHPACPFGAARTPAMVALVRDIVSNRPIGIHRTALDPDGRKAVIEGKSRMALGAISGGVVKLDPDEEVEQGLGIGEGLETSLALRQRWGAPVWSCISAPNLKTFPVLGGVECLAIAADHDENEVGQRAAAEVARRWREAGREVAIFFPNQLGDDLNDTGEADER